MALSKGHQHVARLFLAKGILEEKELAFEINEIEKVVQDGIVDHDIDDIVTRLKNKLRDIGMTIEEIVYTMPHPCKYFGLRTLVTGDKISEFSVDFDVKLVKLFQKIVDAACENRGYVKWSQILRENNKLNEEHRARASSKKTMLQVTEDEVRSFLNRLLSMRWLGAYRGVDLENGELVIDLRAVFTLGPRTMCDLRQYLDDRGDDLDLDACSLCQDVCWLRGAPCGHSQCPSVMHEQCLERYGRRQCPLCQQDWRSKPESVDLFGGSFGAAQSGQLSVIGDDDDEDEELESGVDVSSHMDSAFETPGRPVEPDEDEEESDSDVDMEE